MNKAISGPSGEAIKATGKAAWEHGWGYTAHHAQSAAEKILPAAHHPALGLDRSVCLRDVVELFRAGGYDPEYAAGGFHEDVADFIEAEFTT